MGSIGRLSAGVLNRCLWFLGSYQSDMYFEMVLDRKIGHVPACVSG